MFGVSNMIITCPPKIDIIRETIQFCKENEGCYLAVGFVPWKARDLWDLLPQNGREDDKIDIMDEFFLKLEDVIEEDQASEDKKIMAVGLCGFDLERLKFCSKEM